MSGNTYPPHVRESALTHGEMKMITSKLVAVEVSDTLAQVLVKTGQAETIQHAERLIRQGAVRISVRVQVGELEAAPFMI